MASVTLRVAATSLCLVVGKCTAMLYPAARVQSKSYPSGNRAGGRFSGNRVAYLDDSEVDPFAGPGGFPHGHDDYSSQEFHLSRIGGSRRARWGARRLVGGGRRWSSIPRWCFPPRGIGVPGTGKGPT